MTSYWLKSSAAWFLNGPGGHLVTCAVGPGWRRGRGGGGGGGGGPSGNCPGS